jgi:hypothetical protein
MLKAQINIHFIVSLILFSGILFYLVYFLITFYPTYRYGAELNILYAKAYQISEFLIKDPGEPLAWNSNNYMRIGLAATPYLLKQSKINALKELCNTTNKTKIKKLSQSFGLEDNAFEIYINYLDGTNLVNCSFGAYIGKKARIKRIAIFNDSLVEVIVYVS